MRCLFYFLLVYKATFGSHFDGGTIRWAPLNNNVTTSPVQIVITQTYTYTLSLVTCTIGSLIGTTIYGYNFDLWCISNCGATSAGYVAPRVLGYCTGKDSALNLAFSQRTDTVNLTANDHFSVAYSITSTATAGYYRALTLSSGGTDSSAQWNITATIDIRPRADNGLINTPPVANVMSPYGIPYNVTTQIAIPTMDVDGDDVRCRWSNSSLECGDVCFPRTIPASTTLSPNCTLTITGTSMTGWYCAAIQVEDFLNTSTLLQPMSSTPVQFLIYVYKTKNCSVPTLTSPSTCVGVRVGVAYKLTLTAINSCGSSSNISDIAVQSFSGIVEGPLVKITPNKTVYEMNITYTPLASQVGLQILCATALDNTNIPSNQYCITFIVGSTVTPTCPGVTTTTTQTTTSTYHTTTTTISHTVTENTDITSVAIVTSSSQSVMDTSIENLQTSDTINIDATSEIDIASFDATPSDTNLSDTTPLISPTTSVSKRNSINWPLIGSLIALISLLALLCSCCFCYHFLWGPAARRRRRRHSQKENKPRLGYRAVNEIVTDLIKISHPPKAYQIYDIDTDRARSSNSKKIYLRTKTSSLTTTNIIRPESVANSTINKPPSSLSRPFSTKNIIQPETIENPTIEKAPPSLSRPIAIINEDDTSQFKQDVDASFNKHNSNKKRAKSTVTVTRILSKKRRKSMPNERKKRRPSRSKVLVTRIKK